MTDLLETLAPMDVAGRLPRLRAVLAEKALPALLVTSRANVQYLTGFTGSAGSLLVSADDALFVTDGRYRTQSAEQIAAAGVDARVEIGLTMAEQRQMFAAAVRDAGSQVGLEEYIVTWAEQRDFAAAFEGVEVVPAGHARRGPAPRQGRRRGRPHPCRLCDRERRVRRAPPAAG